MNKQSRTLFVTLFLLVGIISYIVLIQISNKPPQTFVDQPLTENFQELPEESNTLPADTTNWKTLNNEIGFSFKYPEHFTIEAGGIGVDETNAPYITVKNVSGTEIMYIDTSFKPYTVFSDQDLHEIANNNFESNKAKATKVLSPIKLINLNGKEVYTYKILSNGYKGTHNGFLMVREGDTNANYEIGVVEAENADTLYIIAYITDNPEALGIISTFEFEEKGSEAAHPSQTRIAY